jgi:anti-anti-sigma factor
MIIMALGPAWQYGRRLDMDDALAITVGRERGYVIVAVVGEIDISTVTELRERLFELVKGSQLLIVDLNRVTFIDSAGLGALVGAAATRVPMAVACARSAQSREPGNCCG